MIDIAPMTKLSWKSGKLKETWEPKMRRASAVYHEAEYVTVLKGLRKVATVHIDLQNMDEMIERITSDGLIFLPICRSKRYAGFSHKHFYTTKDDPDSFSYGVLSKSLEDAEAYREASQPKSTDHDVIGDLLKYPKCCRDWFADVWSQGIYDPLWESAANTKGAKVDGNTVTIRANPYTSNYLRYFGLRVISHLTCSQSCRATERIAKRVWLPTMREIDGEATDWLLELLSMPMEWSVLRGIAVIDHPLFYGVVNSVPTLEKKTVKLEVSA